MSIFTIILIVALFSVVSARPPIVDIEFKNIEEGKTYSQHITNITFNLTGEITGCWYSLNGESTLPEADLSYCNQGINVIEGIISKEGFNTWTVYARGIDGFIRQEVVNFIVRIPKYSLDIRGIENNQILTSAPTSIDFYLNWSGEIDTCRYSINNGRDVYFNCNSGLNTIDNLKFEEGVNTFKEGENTMNIIGTLKECNYFDTKDSVNFTINTLVVDTLPPIVLITNPINGTVYTSHRTSMTFNVNDSNLHSCWYSLNGGTNISTSCSNGINTINSITSIEGINTWKVYARDTYGNIGSDKVIFTVNSSEIIISHPIDLTIITPLEGESIYCPTSFEVFSENATTVSYSIDGNANISMTEGPNNIFTSSSFSLEEGNHNVLFCASNAFNSTCTLINFKVIEKSPKKTCTNCNKVRILPDYEIPEEHSNVIFLQEEVNVKQKLTFWQRILDFFRNLFR
jgi:hypothetical protein